MMAAKMRARIIPFWPPKARPMNMSNNVISVSRNAVLNVFPIVVLFQGSLHSMLRAVQRCTAPILGRPWLSRGPPSPRSLGIIELAGNCEIIYGAQAVTGKILSRKGLASDADFWPARMIRRLGCGRQGLWSHRNGFF